MVLRPAKVHDVVIGGHMYTTHLCSLKTGACSLACVIIVVIVEFIVFQH